MATLRYTDRAIADLVRLASFLRESDREAADSTAGVIEHGLGILELHPLVGRPAEHGCRELVISRGRSGYIALYRYRPVDDAVFVHAIRHQREAGFQD